MSDLLERLRAEYHPKRPPLFDEAANEIERLRNELAEVTVTANYWRYRAKFAPTAEEVIDEARERIEDLELELTTLKAQGEPVGWAFFFEDGEPSNEYFSSEAAGLEWINSEDCLWDGYIAPLYTIGREKGTK